MGKSGIKTAENENVITLTLSRGLNESENDLLMNRTKDLEQRLGMKVIVIPFSTDSVDGEE
jgi:hypothetical protein